MEKLEPKNRKGRKFTAYAAVLMVLVLVVAIPLNLLASRLNVIWDMTPQKMYKLTDKTRKMLDGLEQDVDMYFLLDMETLSTDDDSMALYYTLQQYDAYDRIHLIDFDVNAHPELVQQADPDGIYAQSMTTGDFIIRCGDRSKLIPGTNMYRYNVSYDDDGNRHVEAAFFTGENYLTGAINSVVTGLEANVYFLSGHGEMTLSGDYTTFQTNLAALNYVPESLNLATMTAVPEDADIIIVADPQYDLSNDETRMLNDYLERGGNIFFLMPPNDSATKFTNIESILRSFGIGMDYDIVRETDPNLYVGLDDYYTFQCSVVATDEGIDLTSGLSDMIDAGIVPYMTNTRSFYLSYLSGDSSLQTGSLLQTTALGTDDLGNSVGTAVGEAMGGGNTESITGGIPLDLAMYSMSTSRNNAKLVVFGNAEFIDDANVSQDYMIIPVYTMLSCITWMYDSNLDLDMGISDKERDYDSIPLNSANAANTASVVFMAVPFGVALIGLIVWLRRRYS